MAGLVPPSAGEIVDRPMAYAQQVRASHNDDDSDLATTMVAKEWQGTEVDRKDMSQLGKVQQLRVLYTIPRECEVFADNSQRNFHFLSIFGFDGGTAGLLWGFLIVIAGFSFVYLSIAEMASMAPTSGGQYHW
ncbi:hypothetical protein LTR37_013544 [Vermiconidia calcicola]|uniref:Uncharacterized protein n=1 Tax=Vermiconidia calcicola TaxID=1690605 RepID=A0ACC3MW13_9PEZI|nr:hypothetical protein LTR37_013544 [Vermiconidia calcicola]